MEDTSSIIPQDVKVGLSKVAVPPHKEYETSLRIQISESIFEQMKSMFGHGTKDEVILYYESNVRLSGDKMQYKYVSKKRCFTKMIYYEDQVYFIPYVRKSSLEFQAAIPEKNDVTSIVIRTVIHESLILSKYKMRIALEKQAIANFGLTYAITAEVEYDQQTFVYYKQTIPVEDAFLTIFVDMCFVFLKAHNFESHLLYKVKSHNTIVDVASRVFKMFSTSYILTKSEKVVYKYDGYKGKIVTINDGTSIFYDVLHNTYECSCPALSEFKNIFFQIEIMDKIEGDEYQYVCLVDVLGGYTTTSNFQYMPRPLEVLEFFEWLRNHLKTKKNMEEPYDLILYDISGNPTKHFKMFTQREIQVDAPVETRFPYDGYIVIESDKLFKFKRPTLDVIFVNGCMEISNRVGPISNQHFVEYADKNTGNVYEVIQNPDQATYSVLRCRDDRTVPSTNEQYEAFLKELAFFRNAVNAANNTTLLTKMFKKLEEKKKPNNE
ncbi:LEF-4 [Penaeus vannamei nudivirus]|nr:LEF-4 [Penaeus vannamei nucleopolyhedrovirus]